MGQNQTQFELPTIQWTQPIPSHDAYVQWSDWKRVRL